MRLFLQSPSLRRAVCLDVPPPPFRLLSTGAPYRYNRRFSSEPNGTHQFDSKSSDASEDQAHTDHSHDQVHGATHQATHRVTEKASFAVLERLLDSVLLGRGARAGGERVLEHAAPKLVERTSERAAERALERGTEIVARAAEHSGVTVARTAGQQALKVGAEGALRAASRAGALEALEKGIEKGAEKAVVAHVGAHAGLKASERLAESVAAEAWVHGGRVGVSRVAERILLRAGRGLAVALPAIGSLFILHLVREDRRRAREEMAKRNLRAGRAFWLAFLCDATDVAAHVVIVVSLLHVHYGVGVALPHEWLHLAEWGGLWAAAVSTVAAILGELWTAWRPQRMSKVTDISEIK